MIKRSTKNCSPVSLQNKPFKNGASSLQYVINPERNLMFFADGPSKLAMIAGIQFRFNDSIFVGTIPEYGFCPKVSISNGLGLENGFRKIRQLDIFARNFVAES